MNARWEHKVPTYEPRWKGFDYEKIEQDPDELGRHGWEALGTVAPSYSQDLVVVLKRTHA
jgi:hypothetical protein